MVIKIVPNKGKWPYKIMVDGQDVGVGSLKECEDLATEFTKDRDFAKRCAKFMREHDACTKGSK